MESNKIAETIKDYMTEDAFIQAIATEYKGVLKDAITTSDEIRPINMDQAFQATVRIPMDEFPSGITQEELVDTAGHFGGVWGERYYDAERQSEIFSRGKELNYDMTSKTFNMTMPITFQEANTILNDHGMLRDIHEELGSYPKWDAKHKTYKMSENTERQVRREEVMALVAPVMNASTNYSRFVEDYGRMLNVAADNKDDENKVDVRGIEISHEAVIELSSTDITKDDVEAAIHELKLRREINMDAPEDAELLYDHITVSTDGDKLVIKQDVNFDNASELIGEHSDLDWAQDKFNVFIDEDFDIMDDPDYDEDGPLTIMVVDDYRKDEDIQLDMSDLSEDQGLNK